MKRKLDSNDAPTVEVSPSSKSAKVEAVTGSDSTASAPTLPTFESFDLDPRLLQAIAKHNYAIPTPVQHRMIPLALQGKDVLTKSQTGSGKTAAYVLPILQALLKRKSSDSKHKSTSVLILVPTRELADQVTRACVDFAEFCGKHVKALNLTQRVSDAVLSAKLQETPDIVVTTPGKMTTLLNLEVLSLAEVKMLVIDEADLILSYGYEDDISGLIQILPPNGVQSFLLSATLTPEVDQLKAQFCRDPVVVRIAENDGEGEGGSENGKANKISQYVVKCAEDEKFLLIYVIFKLKLIKGKIIIFVADIDRSYRLKLYLEQFGIKSCILNSELPVNSRLHVVQEFNKGLYDILIAADDQEVIGGVVRRTKSTFAQGIPETEENGDGNENGEATDDEERDEDETEAPASKKTRGRGKDFGVSRGIDFQNVSCVLNFDLPSSSKGYTHRIGRTARAGRTGMALSFVIPRDLFGKHRPTSVSSSRHDEKILEKIKARQAKKGKEVKDYHFDMKQVEAFRYRFNDMLRAVTGTAVREARTREIKQELIKSEKLRKHFEDNPDDLKALRHDSGSHGVMRVQGHLRHVPEYLLPGGGEQTKGVAETIGSVPFNTKTDDDRKKNRRKGKGKGKANFHRAGGRNMKGKSNPLKSFRAGKR